MEVFISGVDSGPNPSPGIGIARSLRAAFPSARLVAVDYSARSSGLLWHDFDACVVRPPWQSIDLATHISFVASVLARGAIWISGLDLELQLLTRRLRPGPNLLCPPLSTLKLAAKPPEAFGKRLGFPIPPFLHCGPSSDEALGHFCRVHGWPIWVKGPDYGALPIWSWYEAATVIHRMAEACGGRDRLFLQTHVEGEDVTIAFAAWKGELLGAALLEKTVRTPDGKAWSGRVGRVPRALESRLGKLIRDTRWSGGGEIECVRDPLFRLWLLECNPRFPAWIHGATLAGINLPALLLEAATGERPKSGWKESRGSFTRVVLEVPACA